jgi:hypothetical protein
VRCRCWIKSPTLMYARCAFTYRFIAPVPGVCALQVLDNLSDSSCMRSARLQYPIAPVPGVALQTDKNLSDAHVCAVRVCSPPYSAGTRRVSCRC